MRRGKLQIIVSLFVIAAAGPAVAQTQMTSNPIPTPFEKRSLAVKVVDLARLPDTRGIRPAAQHRDRLVMCAVTPLRYRP